MILLSRKKKTSEPAWMSVRIRKLIRRRRAIFRKFGRNDSWAALKEKTNELIRTRRDNFNKGVREKFLNKIDSKNFHKGIKTFMSSTEVVN